MGSTNKGLTKKRILIMAICLLVIINIVLGSCINTRSKREISIMYESMSNTVITMNHMSASFDTLSDNFSVFNDKDTFMYLESAMMYLRKNGYRPSTLEKASSLLWEDGKLYYCYKSGELIQAPCAEPLGLTKEELKVLNESGEYEKAGPEGQIIYASYNDANKGYLITSWLEESIEAGMDNLNTMDYCYEDAMVIDSETNDVLEAKEGSPVPVGGKVELIKDNNNSKYALLGITGVAIKADNGFTGYGVAMLQRDGTTLIVYEPMSKGVFKVISELIYPAELLILFVAIMACFSVNLARNSDRYRLIRKGVYLNTGSVTHIVALLLSTGVILLCLTFHLEVLTTYSRQNQVAKINLESFDNSLVSEREIQESVEEVFRENLESRAQIINWFLVNCPDILESNEIEKLANLLGLQEISVFNKNGLAIYSNTGYEGYSLSQNEDDEEYDVWKLLREQTTTIVKPIYGGDGYMTAVRRKDDTGIVLIKALAQDLNAMLKATSVENAIINADFNHAVKIYIDNEKPETMYWLEPNSTKIESVENRLSPSVMRDNYAGSKNIDGVTYYLNTYKLEDYTLISACRRSILAREYYSDWIKIFVAYIAIIIVILLSTCFEKNISVDEEADNDNANENLEEPENMISTKMDSSILLDTKLRSMLNKVFFIILGVLILTLLIESGVSRNSILGYLTGNVWENGLNVFGITMAIVVLLSASICSIMVEKIVKLLSDNLGSGAVTVGHLVISIAKVIIWVTAVFMSFIKLGTNPTALFTGAGLTSVVIGIGAQSTVSDIISGIFLVLEGHVRVGDWVTVNGFRGVVTSMGLRTTKISLYGDTISVNNANMRDIINLSKEPSRIELYFTVDYGTDLERVRDIIKNNAKRYAEDCPELTSAPHFENVFEMGTNGLELMIWVYCNEKDKTVCKNQAMRTTYELLAENGIGIPYNVITISNK